jgi:DNA-binding response OmpR family regulator
MDARKRKVLIVEDNFSNVVMLEAKLLDRQFDVKIAYNGIDGLDMLRAEPFDIVLLDVMLPGMDGFEVCRRIRQMASGADTPVIMLTALDTESDRVEGMAAGADYYFLKPVEDNVLFGRMQTLMQQRTPGTTA